MYLYVVHVHVHEASMYLYLYMSSNITCHTFTQCEQMGVELHDVSASVRPALKGRLENYRKELARIHKEFVSSQCVLHALYMYIVHVYMYCTCTCTCIDH